ncbi:hypothetical protein Bca4012_086519 [Brassica carinata]
MSLLSRFWSLVPRRCEGSRCLCSSVALVSRLRSHFQLFSRRVSMAPAFKTHSDGAWTEQPAMSVVCVQKWKVPGGGLWAAAVIPIIGIFTFLKTARCYDAALA